MKAPRPLLAPDSLARRVAIRGGLVVLGITVTLWGALMIQQGRRVQAVLEQESRRAEALARSTAELAQRVLAVADRALANAGRSIEAGADPQAAVDMALAYTGLDGAVITSLRFLDAQGRPLGERLTRPAVQGTPEDFASREYFRVHVDSPSVGLHLSRTVYGRQAGARVFVMSRRLDHVDGRMRGVLQVGMDAAWLGSLLSHMGEEMRIAVNLIGDDGAVRVRTSTDGEVSFDRTLPAEHPLLPLLAARRVSARLDLPSSIEPGARLLAMRRLESFPLAIVVGEREDAMMARTASEGRVALWLLGAATVLLWTASGAAIALVGRIERTRDALRGALARARAASRAKSAFLGSLAHELRTPLTGILGYSSLIERRSPDPHARGIATTLRTSADRLRALLDEMLDAARSGSGAESVTLAPEPIREIVSDAGALFAPAAGARGTQLACHIGEAVPERVACDGMRMRQILNFLLSRAVMHATDGTITLTASVVSRADGDASRTEAFAGQAAGDAVTGGFMPWLRIQVVGTARDLPVQAPANDSVAEFARAREFMRRMGGDLASVSVEGLGTAATAWLPLSDLPACPASLRHTGAGRAVA